jgi:transcription elongation factor GreA
MSDAVPMTRDGFNKIKAEVERLEQIEMPKIAEKIAAARAEGDLKENAEYHAQRENQGLVQARINELKGKLARASIVDPSSLPKDEVVFGATVHVKDLDYDDEESFTLVGAGDEDYDNGRILITSPIGQGLLGKKVGQKVEIAVPRGQMRLEVLRIEFNF